MNVLITGGLGTIGQVLVSELRRRGHHATVSDVRHHHDPDYIRCDVGSYYQLQRVFDKGSYDVVYHLAAEFGRWNGEDYFDSLWTTNAIGTKNMLQFQKKLGFRLVFSSSSEVYGDWTGLMKEDVMDSHEVRQLNDYAISKWVNELQILNSAAQDQTETVRVRLFNTYGPGEYYSPYRSAVCRFVYYALHDMPYTVFLGHRRTSTYVADTVRTLANIADNFHPGEVYNIGGTRLHDMKSVSDTILDYLGKADDKVSYQEAEPFTTRVKNVSTEKAARDLDHKETVALEEGVARTIRWMQTVYRPGEPEPRRLASLEPFL